VAISRAIWSYVGLEAEWGVSYLEFGQSFCRGRRWRKPFLKETEKNDVSLREGERA
jgi:hypothetical protein